MNRTATIIALIAAAGLGGTVGYLAPESRLVEANRVVIDSGEVLELQARQIDGVPNPNFTKYRNASPRIFLRDGDSYRVLVEINGQILNTTFAAGKAVCPANLRQPVVVRVRVEEPAAEPVEPAVGELEITR